MGRELLIDYNECKLCVAACPVDAISTDSHFNLMQKRLSLADFPASKLDELRTLSRRDGFMHSCSEFP
ncbi:MULTISPECIES: 4Fe-4S binding protein [Nostoc]|uniref:4Fe-4S binding protein n=1 Tax=Nostoc TaxID=1177 RepID=UPI002412E3E1|nr:MULTISPECIES: 4Fe-4S binding protein [Nostoc]